MHSAAISVELEYPCFDGSVEREAESDDVAMEGLAEGVVTEVRSGFEERWEGEWVGENGEGFHEGEEVEGLLEGWGKGVGFDNGVEEDDVGVLGVGEDASGVREVVEGGAEGDEVGEDLVGMVEAMAEEVGVDLGEVGEGFGAVKET